jgi:hypothetical protein
MQEENRALKILHQRLICFLLVYLIAGGLTNTHGQENKQMEVLIPLVDGEWWDIVGNPDLGKYTSEKQQPVDFGIWQAADGTLQLWSCIRGTKCGGRTRLFYRWEAKNITDKNWTPKGIAMEADTTLGEEKGGLQAPFVLKEWDGYYMFYGDWNRICMAHSADGKTFIRLLSENDSPGLFQGPLYNTRDPMVLKIGNIYYCYYTGHMEKDDKTDKPKSAVFCRTSRDLKKWSDPVVVLRGGSAAKLIQWYGGDSECPHVVKVRDSYVMFRTHRYGKDNLTTAYCSSDPLDFGDGTDQYQVGRLAVAAPEIIKVKNQYYIAALKPTLDGIRIAKLKFVKK